jgi:hypothetical protein
LSGTGQGKQQGKKHQQGQEKIPEQAHKNPCFLSKIGGILPQKPTNFKA